MVFGGKASRSRAGCLQAIWRTRAHLGTARKWNSKADPADLLGDRMMLGEPGRDKSSQTKLRLSLGKTRELMLGSRRRSGARLARREVAFEPARDRDLRRKLSCAAGSASPADPGAPRVSDLAANSRKTLTCPISSSRVGWRRRLLKPTPSRVDASDMPRGVRSRFANVVFHKLYAVSDR